MISVSEVQDLALSFPETVESPHFEKTSFRVRKKIFLTLNRNKKEAVVKLSEKDQDIYCMEPGGAILPVEGAWGKKGWTVVKLDVVDIALFKAVLVTSFVTVAPKKLGLLIV